MLLVPLTFVIGNCKSRSSLRMGALGWSFLCNELDKRFLQRFLGRMCVWCGLPSCTLVNLVVMLLVVEICAQIRAILVVDNLWLDKWFSKF